LDSQHNNDLVTVMEIVDEGLLAVAKSLLEANNIAYYAKYDMLIGGYCPPVELQVSRAHAEIAYDLLKNLVGEDQVARVYPRRWTGVWAFVVIFVLLELGVLVISIVKR